MDVGLHESLVVSLDGCVHSCALRSLSFGSICQLKPHSQTERTHLWYCGVLLFWHGAILLKRRSVKNCCRFKSRCFCFANLVESLHLNTLVCNLQNDCKLNTRRSEQLALYMTTSCSPSFLNGRITKNCTYCRLITTHFPSFSFVRGLASFLVGGLGDEDSNRMFSTKSQSYCLWHLFVGMAKQEVSRSKAQTFREQKQHIRNTFAVVPLVFLRKSVQHFLNCRSVQNAEAGVEI